VNSAFTRKRDVLSGEPGEGRGTDYGDMVGGRVSAKRVGASKTPSAFYESHESTSPFGQPGNLAPQVDNMAQRCAIIPQQFSEQK
jgi:hypothetical protein